MAMKGLPNDERRKLSFQVRRTNRVRVSKDEWALLETVRSRKCNPYEIAQSLLETGQVPDELQIQTDREIIKLEARAKELRRKYLAALGTITDLEKRNELIAALKQDKQQPILTLRPKKTSRQSSSSIAIAVSTDIHAGEVIQPATVYGLNEYNKDVIPRRLGRYFDRLLYLVDLMRHETEIKTLVLALLGDMISGDIHEELRETNDLTPAEAVMLLTRLYRDGIDYLTANGNFDEIIVVCCYGNHGRTTDRLRFGESAIKRSYEMILYGFLAMLYKDHPTVHFRLPTGYFNLVKIFNKYLIRFHHGHMFRYRGGIGGITIPVNRSIAEFNKTRRADYDIFGHFHQFNDYGSWMSTGSLVGYSPIAMEKFKAFYEPPTQLFTLIEKNRGKTFTIPIQVDKPMKITQNA